MSTEATNPNARTETRASAPDPARPSRAIPAELAAATGAGVPARSSRLSTRVRSVPASGIRKFFDVIATMPDVISLGVGEPDSTTPQRILDAGVRSLESGRTHYTSNYGTLELRTAIADELAGRFGVRYDPATEVVVTVGGSEAVADAMLALLDPGDEVLLHDPSYVAYVPGVVFAGGVPVPVPTRAADGFALDPDEVERRVTPRTRMLFLGYPCNPTGAVLPPDVLRALAEIAIRHDLVVVSDEIYARLVYGEHRHEPIASLPGMRERTVTIGGFSKAYAMTGWRLGYACAPKELVDGIMKVHQYAIMCAPTTAQDAAVVALRECEEDVERMLAEYDRRRRMFVDGLNRIGLPTVEPRGAFYAFPDISVTGLSSDEFSERLLFDEHVAVVPGDAFGESGAGHVRACYATSYEQIEEALVRIERFVSSRR